LWDAGGALSSAGGVITTVLDTVVVAGGGFPTRGAGPGAVVVNPPIEWAVVTGTVTVRLGTIVDLGDPELMTNRGTNTISAMAARFAAATWHPCLPPQGVKVDASL